MTTLNQHFEKKFPCHKKYLQKACRRFSRIKGPRQTFYKTSKPKTATLSIHVTEWSGFVVDFCEKCVQIWHFSHDHSQSKFCKTNLKMSKKKNTLRSLVAALQGLKLPGNPYNPKPNNAFLAINMMEWSVFLQMFVKMRADIALFSWPISIKILRLFFNFKNKLPWEGLSPLCKV